MNDFAIRVENLSKLYQVGQFVGYQTLRESLVSAFSAPFRRFRSVPRNEPRKSDSEYIWALKDVSFEVKPGEAVGIIGRNGAGKSTLLKILCRITEPTEGYGEIHGRVGSLLEVGTGFHSELTGRENVYLYGAVLGMKRKELDRKFDEIVDFSGEMIRDFIDTPLKRYSSGMQVRLAFAVAAHLEPEILLVDEVLAVGDVAFQKKCLGKMEEDVTKGGRTVLFVSHNMGMIDNLCERCLLLESGKIIQDGESSSVISRYLTNVSPAKGSEISFPEDISKQIQIRRVAVMDEELNLKSQFDVFEQVTVEIEYEVREEMIGSVVVFGLQKEGVLLFWSYDTDRNQELFERRLPGYYQARVKLPCPFKAGNYTISMATMVPNRDMIDPFKEAISFEVEEITPVPISCSYARNRPGYMAADLVWKTEKVAS